MSSAESGPKFERKTPPWEDWGLELGEDETELEREWLWWIGIKSRGRFEPIAWKLTTAAMQISWRNTQERKKKKKGNASRCRWKNRQTSKRQ
jgi:hypothetical protein